ncbi:cilia- and flagella-associated protein 43 [Lutzomyia longipalpis]|uniref:cilia- and flagella-associated protein 43 n=1 Tax=Lutzomyia longipalpis TaxID=7200 RepID=UPI00248341B5|nr:cilia- and flagella-associated protein 43 [Lutzomyia longipalpis]
MPSISSLIEVSWVKQKHVEASCFLGKGILATGQSNSIVFTDISTGNEKTYRADSFERGDGISCIAGHRSLQIFALAEFSQTPSILVQSYPGFETICRLQSTGVTNYLYLAFSETEYLVALAGIPDFTLEVWCWRSGQLLATRKSGIFASEQMILCSPSQPLSICQLATGTGKLTIWDIHVCVDTVKLIEKKIKMSFTRNSSPFISTYLNGGTLLVATRKGCVHQVYPGNNQSLCIVQEMKDDAPGGSQCLIAPHQNGFFLSVNHKIRLFTQNGTMFTEIHSICPENLQLRFLGSQSNDLVVGLDEHGSVWKILSMENHIEVKEVKKRERIFHKICLINPGGIFLATVDRNRGVSIFEVASGKLISQHLAGGISSLASHPLLPVISLGYSSGHVELLSLYSSEKPQVLVNFHVGNSSIEMLKFSGSGSHIVAVDAEKEVFAVLGQIGGIVEIWKHFSVPRNVLDFIVLEDGAQNLKILMLLKSEHSKLASYEILLILLSKEDTQLHPVCLPGKKITSIDFLKSAEIFVATMYLDTKLKIFKLVEESEKFELIELQEVKTEHCLKYVKVRSCGDFILSWGLDGQVCLFDSRTMECMITFVSHHRRTHGVQEALVSASLEYIICLGFTGSLICFRPNLKIMHLEHSTGKTELSRLEIREKCLSPTIGHFPATAGDASWLEVQRMEQKNCERQKYQERRDAILRDLDNLRREIGKLLDNNEICPDEEKLPIHEFNLDSNRVENMIKKAERDRQAEIGKMQEFMAAQNEITVWIRKSCWDQMSVKSTKVRGIFTDLFIENYPVLEMNGIWEKRLSQILMWIQLENLTNADKFLPWKPIPTTQLEFVLNQEPRILSLDKVKPNDGRASRTPLASGTSTIDFITSKLPRYNQLEVVTFEQMHVEKIFGYFDALALREFFNKHFCELQERKEQEMQIVKERNNRLREIQSELNILSQLLGTNVVYEDDIIDPEYTPDEKPHTIVQVTDEEVPVEPYISPSMQELIEREAYEAEQKRLALMADDFRERALQHMMDGVLEIRWEDEIKKKPNVPAAVQTKKDLREYDEHDWRAVREYEEKLNFLDSEREKYRDQLLSEKQHLQETLDRQIYNFNKKLAELAKLKVKVQMAINQEDMKILRNSMYNYRRIQFTRQEHDFRQEIISVKRQINALTAMMHDAEKRALDCKVNYDGLETKDRLLDKQFKNNFGEFAPISLVDQAYKLFKRRPRWTMRAWATSVILTDVAKRVISRNLSKSGPPLPQECFDYLNLIEQIDQPANCPTMDEKLWDLLCRMRRIKIESEFKVRSCGVQLAEADASVDAFSREISARRTTLAAHDKKLEELKENRQKNSVNRTIQLVMKRGNVEIPLTGKISDFDDAILLSVNDVDDINRVIKKSGQKKLLAMSNAAVFRRKLIHKEWEHRVLKMTIRDMKDFVKVVEKCKITKEVQTWLKRKQKGWTEDVSQAALNREIEAMIASCEKSFSDVRKQVTEIEEKIEQKKRENENLDRKIQTLNFDVSKQHEKRDPTLEEQEVETQNHRLEIIAERTRLVRKVQRQHTQILELSTLLELQRLRTYPTLSMPQSSANPRNA